MADLFTQEPSAPLAEALRPKTLDEEDRTGGRFPLNRDRLVGVVHADGNGIGAIVRGIYTAARDLGDADYIALYRAFSDGLTDATHAAAREAAEAVLLPRAEAGVLPARPLVLGGDDDARWWHGYHPAKPRTLSKAAASTPP